jgi:TolB-like protein/tRNA A-37 threonylcarbamoyl transferase component Bud32
VAIKCPQCQSENTDTARFCSNCAASLLPAAEVSAPTETLVAPKEELTRGTTFANRYEIIEELGRGGMGVVYKAKDTKLKRTVALKFLPPELTHISNVKERFIHEAQAAASLDHPNICTVHEFDEAEEKTFISMAYVEGQSLNKKIESGPLKLDEALRIATQVAEGLQEAHKKGVVHRDIKSANIMVTEKSQAKIMDFGLARATGGTLVTKEGIVMGTIAYMSPEQARGEKVDHRTDIWSLGVVLYEMFSGQLPFKGEYDQAVVYSILKEKPEPITHLRSEIPMSIEQVVGKALEKNPDERYQHMEELLDDLKSISEGIEPEGIRARLRKAKLLRRKKAILYAGIAGLLIIMTMIALSVFTGRGEAIDSIAVLPLENLSGDPDQEYFVEGMHEALITELSKIRALKVISRPSVMRYKNSDKSLPEIAKELNVEGIVAGSAQQEGGKIRITVQLIEAETERNLWAERYDKDYRDILMLHGEVALDIAQEIRIAVTPAEQTRLASARPVDSEAYELYLKGRYYWNRFSPEWINKALDYYNQAIEKDPDYALAYTAKAETYVMLSTGFSILTSKDAMPKVREVALRALELDPIMAEAHVSLGLVATCYDWDHKAAKKHFEKALELNPNSVSAHQWIEFYLTFLEGEYEEGLAHLERVQELDPLNPYIKARFGWMYYYLRDFDRAIALFKENVEFDPNNPLGHKGLAEAYSKKGMYDKAIAEAEKVLELEMRSVSAIASLGSMYGLAGKKDKALELLSELEARSSKGYVSPFSVAELYMGLGEMDKTFEWLEKAYEERELSLIYITVPTPFDILSPDPRYKQLLKKIGIEHLFEKLSSLKK